MEILKRITLLLIILLPFAGGTQEYFFKKYTGSTFDSGNGITQLPDSSYVVTGSSGAFDEYSSQTILMKVDKSGNHLWTKAYGGAGNDVGMRVMHIENDGFLIAGYSTSTPDGGFDFVLYKTDEQGTLQWEKYYGGSNWEILHDAQLLQDGGVILVGQTEGPTTNGTDVFMVRTDAFGDTIWTKTLSSLEKDIAYAIDTLSATEFVIGGIFGDGGASKGMLAQFNIDGTQNWMNFYDQDGASIIRDVFVYNNRIFAVGGILTAPDEHFNWMLKTFFDGNFDLSWYGPQDVNSLFNSIVVRDDNSVYNTFYADALHYDPYPYGNDAFVIKFHVDLYFNNYSVSFSASGDDFLNQIILTLDGGVAAVGTSSDSENLGVGNYLGTDLMIVKIGPNDEKKDAAETGLDLVGLSEENISNLHIYPNPVNTKVNIPEEVYGLPYDLVDFRGGKVLSGNIDTVLDLSGFDTGVYFLRVKGQDKIWNAKIIKQ